MKELYRDETRMLSGIELILVLGFLIALFAFWTYCLLTQKEGSELYLPPVIAVLILILMLVLLATALLLKLKLVIYEDRIEITAVRTKTVKFSEVKSCEVVGIKAVRQFGGFGIRWAPFKKIGYIIPGMDGVEIKCENEKIVVICSETPEKIKTIIDSRMKG